MHYYGYVSGVDEKHVFDSHPISVEKHKQACGGKFHACDEPSSEILAELRQIKRKRNSIIRNMRKQDEIPSKLKKRKIERRNVDKVRYSTD